MLDGILEYQYISILDRSQVRLKSNEHSNANGHTV